jgi:hypothetical protein
MPSDEEVIQRAESLRTMTGLTEEEFTTLLPHFEWAFVAYLQHRTIDGQPRTSRRYSSYATCPLPTIADKLLFILPDIKQHPIQEVLRTTLWDVPIACQYMDSSPPGGAESCVSPSRTPPSSKC